MSDLDKLTELILNIQGNENKLRKESEKLLNQVREANKDQYFLSLLHLLKSSANEKVRFFSATMLRKQLSSYSEASFDPCWKKLSPNTAKVIKEEVFILLRDETKPNIRDQICHLIGELGGTILAMDEDDKKLVEPEIKTWDKLLSHVMELWLSKIDIMLEAALKILTGLFDYTFDTYLEYRNDFHTIFKTGMSYDSLNIKQAAIEALSKWVQSIESKYCRMYEDLVPQMLENVLFLLAKEEDKGVSCLTNIIDIIESEYKFFKKHFDLLFKSMQKIISVKNIEEEGIKELAIQILYSYLERNPRMFKDNEQYIKDLLEMIFVVMIERAEEVTEEWMIPKEGFIEDAEEDDDKDGFKFGAGVIDKMIAVLGRDLMLPVVSVAVQQMMQNANWKFKFSALMTLSQVGEHVKSVDEVGPILMLVAKFLNDEHPKIRFAALHVLGQIADDCNPEFQTKFHESMVPLLVGKLDDPVPRVQSHVLAALSNFMEGLPKDIIKNYTQAVLKAVYPYTQKGISLVRENALATIAATAESSYEYFCPYFEEAAPMVCEILKTETKPEYKQLRGQCVECLTLMVAAVGKEYFRKYSTEVISILVNLQKNDISSDSLDPLRLYLLSGWERICAVMEDEFVPYLDQVIPSLFKIVEKVLKVPKEDKKEPETTETEEVDPNDKKKNFNTFEHEEADVAISMILSFVTELGKHYFSYVADTTALVLAALNYNQSNKIRKTASECLPALLICIKESDNPNKQQLLAEIGRSFIRALCVAMSSEYEAEVIGKMVEALKEIIDVVGRFMNEAEIGELSRHIFKILSESHLRKKETEKEKETEDYDDEVKEAIDLEVDDEEDLHVEIAELFGKLFHTHKELTVPVAKILYNDVLKTVLGPDQSDKMHKFGLFIIDDMIEHLGIELIPNEWPSLQEVILKFATDKTCFVRQAALYGIGVLTETSKETVMPFAMVYVTKVLEALKIPKGSENDRLYGLSRDNATAALGKLIRQCGDALNIRVLVPEWINNMPLLNDKPEAKKQHEFLTEIILKANAALVFGENGEHLPKVVQIFAQITNNSKITTPKTEENMANILRALLASNDTKGLLEKAVMPLTELQKQRIEKLIKG
mmetsp:Transcript_71880/g.83546  ORF Transcript_71880/g.83546 Transcript_71880/m.83546 type:complete len:1110 (+) Transcript_71880:60-3389(+)|eukprot:CAMPEP_0176424466 /NCGR_PEP_ID=MMETSP0127-20121128/10851_1 /TAXON_ID=938130 /ORGANISM="Platyophrya macrostoma, Strain WH" /LENGTH=1109 /DNA_ID=CAMNT_0017805523 /DNA_START=55 /DNA_END=3384 /DNA_ORIENTATION=+